MCCEPTQIPVFLAVAASCYVRGLWLLLAKQILFVTSCFGWGTKASLGLSNSHHQDYYCICLVGDPYKPSFATVTGRGDNPRHLFFFRHTKLLFVYFHLDGLHFSQKPQRLGRFFLGTSVDGSEIPNNHLGYYKPPFENHWE